jgi:hypothetical protein
LNIVDDQLSLSNTIELIENLAEEPTANLPPTVATRLLERVGKDLNFV